MATVTPVITPVYGPTNIDGWQVVWSPMHNTDTGAAVGSSIGQQSATAALAPGGGVLSGFADKSVQAVGTFGGGGTVNLQGSNDGGANWFNLTDPLLNTIAIQAAGPFLKEITEAVIWVRPFISAGDGTTNLTVTLFLRKTQQP